MNTKMLYSLKYTRPNSCTDIYEYYLMFILRYSLVITYKIINLI